MIKLERINYLYIIGFLFLAVGNIYFMIKEVNVFLKMSGYNKELFINEMVRGFSMHSEAYSVDTYLSLIEQAKPEPYIGVI